MDVSVMRGAECHTDHQLLRIMLKTKCVYFRTNTQQTPEKEYDVTKLTDANDDTGKEAPRNKFLSRAGMLLKHRWPAEGGAEEKWDAMKTVLIEAAPTLFNLYAAVVVGRWREELEGEQGAGIYSWNTS